MNNNSIYCRCLVLVFSLAMVNFLACTKYVKVKSHTLPYFTTTVDITLPPNGQTGISVTGSQTGNFSIDSFIRKNTNSLLQINNLVSAKIVSCVLNIQNAGDGNNFANFKNFSGEFHTNSNKEDFGINISSNPDVFATSLQLPIDTTEELKSYFTGGNLFTCKLGGGLRRPTQDSMHCEVVCKFQLTVE